MTTPLILPWQKSVVTELLSAKTAATGEGKLIAASVLGFSGASAARALWDITSAVYADRSLNVSAHTGTPHDLFFGDDGSKLFIVSDNKVQRLALGTPWYVDSGGAPDQTLDISAYEAQAKGLSFRADGLRLYVCGNASQAVIEFTLTTAWDLSTAVYAASFTMAGQDTQPVDVDVRPDDLGFFISGQVSDRVYRYDKAAGDSIADAAYSGQSFYVGSEDTSPTGLAFRDDGLGFYVIGAVGDKAYQYALATAWDLNTASYTGESVSVAVQESIPTGLYVRPGGGLFYLLGLAQDKAFQYHMSH